MKMAKIVETVNEDVFIREFNPENAKTAFYEIVKTNLVEIAEKEKVKIVLFILHDDYMMIQFKNGDKNGLVTVKVLY